MCPLKTHTGIWKTFHSFLLPADCYWAKSQFGAMCQTPPVFIYSTYACPQTSHWVTQFELMRDQIMDQVKQMFISEAAGWRNANLALSTVLHYAHNILLVSHVQQMSMQWVFKTLPIAKKLPLPSTAGHENLVLWKLKRDKCVLKLLKDQEVQKF